MPQHISNLPPDAEIARLVSRKCDVRWEGFKGFLQGALPTLVLGGIAGLAIGGVSVLALSAGGALAAGAMLSTGGWIAATTAGLAGLAGGFQGMRQEMAEARAKNYAIDRAIETVRSNAMHGIMPQSAPEPALSPASRVVDRILTEGRRVVPMGQVDKLLHGRAHSEETGVQLH